MKKAAIVLALGVLICAAILATPWGLPSAERADGLAAASSGEIYLAENRSLTSLLYRVDGSGRVSSLHMEYGSARIGAMAGEKDTLYFIRIHPGEGWEVVYQGPMGVYTLPLQKGAAPSSMSAEDGVLSMPVLDADGALILYQADFNQLVPEEAILPTLEPVLRAEPVQGGRRLSACFSGGAVYCLLGDGSVERLTGSGRSIFLEAGSASRLASGSDGLWIACEGGFASGTRLTQRVELLPGAYPADGCTRPGGAVLLAALPGEPVRLHLWNGSELASFSKLTIPFGIRVKAKIPQMLTGLGCYLIAAVIAAICVRLCRRSGRFSTQLTAVSGVCLLLCGIIMGGAGLASWMDESNGETRLACWGALQAESMDSGVLQALLEPDSFSGSVQRTDAELALRAAEAAYASAGGGEITSELLTAEVADPRIAASESRADRAASSQVYPPELSGRIRLAAATGEVQTWKDGNRLVEIRPLTRYGHIMGLLLSELAVDTSRRDLRFLWAAGIWLGTFLIALLVIWLMVRRASLPLRQMTKWMNRIAEGDFSPEPVQARGGEIIEMEHTLQEMGVSLAIKDYETRTTVHSFYRFVPRGIEKLLDRAAVTEVSFGDMAAIHGGVALLSVGNRDQVRAALDDGEFMNFVNGCFASIVQNVDRHNGYLLSNEFNLASMKAVFPEQPDDCVKAGVDVLGSAEALEAGIRPAFSLILHDAHFLYGLAGTEDRVFAFLSSAELDFLEELSGNLQAAGVRLAVTDRQLSRLKGSYSSRYIGFVSSRDGKYTYKLYEILDVYSDVEKAARLQYDGKFQEALRCFYQDDFYLARNGFSAILKTCPEDGIARWYLFASERFYNRGGQEDNTYSLFGADV